MNLGAAMQPRWVDAHLVERPWVAQIRDPWASRTGRKTSRDMRGLEWGHRAEDSVDRSKGAAPHCGSFILPPPRPRARDVQPPLRTRTVTAAGWRLRMCYAEHLQVAWKLIAKSRVERKQSAAALLWACYHHRMPAELGKVANELYGSLHPRQPDWRKVIRDEQQPPHGRRNDS